MNGLPPRPDIPLCDSCFEFPKISRTDTWARWFSKYIRADGALEVLQEAPDLDSILVPQFCKLLVMLHEACANLSKLTYIQLTLTNVNGREIRTRSCNDGKGEQSHSAGGR